MNLSKTKLRRAAAKGLSVTLSATTTLWLAGTSMFLAVPAAHAADESTVTDVTGNNPRIAPNGESERVFLGLNLLAGDTQHVTKLNSVRVHLSSSDTAEEAAVSNIETVRLYTDSSLAGTNGAFDSNDGLLKEITRKTGATASTTVLAGATGANTQAGATSIDLTSVTGLSASNYVKLGTGTTAEIRQALTVVSNDNAANDACASGGGSNKCITVAATTYAHPAGDTVAKLDNALVAVAGTNGFEAFATGNTPVNVGDPGGDGTPDATDALSYNVPTDDNGSNLGDDVFVVLVTKGGAANQTIKAKVFTSDIDYIVDTSTIAGQDTLVTPTVASGAGTTNGETKSVTFGADGVAPTITKVESYDTNNDGIVDRFKVFFSESMASTVTSSANFKDAIGGTASRINALGASTTDLALGSITWQTTTVLNDTAQIDVTNATAYTDHAQSTGDVWTVVYDEDGSDNLVDATGEKLLDTTISTTDKAQPYLVSAELKDTNGNSKVDELDVVFSETMSASSTKDGFNLQNTTVSGSPSYTLGSVLGLKKSSGTDANDNDTIRFAVTESASADVSDTFTLAYTSQTSPQGAFDASAAQNNAQSRSGVSVAKGLNPVILSVEYKDNNNNGRIDRVVVTFNVAVTELGSGNLAGEFALSNGYALVANSESFSGGGKVLTMTITEKTVDDTGVVPDLTYDDDGDAICVVSSGTSCTQNQLLTVNSSTVQESDAASPVLKSVTLYETTANDIWEAGETLQLVMSEPVDPATVSTSWNVVGGTGATAFTDFTMEDGSGMALADNKVPDSGTVSVSGNVITLTPSVSASAALVATDILYFNANEVKDAAGNSAYPTSDIISATQNVVVTPTTAPSVSKVATGDSNGNGVLDMLVVYFNGLVAGSTVSAADFGASKGANFTIGGGEEATSTSPAPADLTITSAATMNGGNDSRVVVHFAEANEDTGKHPQLKYVQGSLADLAGNKVATFNADSADNTKFATTIDKDAKDEADPVVLLKYLKDRNLNGKIDQLIVVFSETMTATNTSSSGWSVSGHVLATNGAYSDNNDYQQYTFAVTNAVYKVDVTELAVESSSMPSVTYASSGVFKDLQSRLLGNVAAGGEQSNVNFVPAPSGLQDGDLGRESGSPAVYVLKHVGSKKFKRHVLSASFDQYYPHLAPFWSKVKVVSDGSLSGYSPSAWIRLAGDTKVYEVNDDGTKHWITCADDGVPGKDCSNEWSASGRDGDGIYTVNQAELNSYTTGPNVVMPDVAD